MRAYHRLIRHDGNTDLFRAVALSAAAMTSRYPFHIHAEGLRGTGKTTILRAAGQLLPPIVRVKDCVYNCRPDRPHCPVHRGMSRAELADIGSEVVPGPFLEISHSAKLGTVLGSIDLSRLIDRTSPVAALLPGTIIRANRGVLFIDEINRLADTAPELADVLLDVMGTKPGRVQVEETGLPTVEMPVEVTVWAASNPDEEPGPLSQVRKQLADRFDFAVTMGRPGDPRAVMAILDKREQEEASPPCGPLAGGDCRPAFVAEQIRRMLAAIYIDFNLESLRAAEGLETAACIAAGQAGRTAVTVADVAAVAPLVLGHRTDNATLAGIMRYLRAAGGETTEIIAAGAATPQCAAQVQAGPAENALPSLLGRLWDGIRRRFGSVRPSAPQAGSGQSASHSSALSSAAGNNIVDPTAVEILAPPAAGKPLASLPPSQYVSRAAGKSDD